MKILKIFLFVFVGIIFQFNSFGQKEDRIWYFGGGCSASGALAGVDFNSGSPVALVNSPMSRTEGSATQSDRNGSLLFYSNGVDVYDRTQNLMLNGSGLGGHVSSEQSSLIIPFVNDTTKFYLFANDGKPTANGTGLHYSIIDMTLNGGLGAVNGTKSVSLQPGTSEALTATKHSNGMDYWVIVTDFDSLIFRTFKITQFGISPAVQTNLGFNSVTWTNVRFNNKGDKITFISNGGNFIKHIADFNLTTGVVSNPIPIDTGAVTDGAEFSPNDSLFYSQTSLGFGNVIINQYKVYSSNIYASRQAVASSSYYADFCDFKLAPDGKIYVTKECADSLDVINFPNSVGAACNYQKNVLWLGGRKAYAFFPNEIFQLAKLPLDVKEFSYNESPFVFPNPSNGDLKINTGGRVVNYVIYNSSGEKVFENKCNTTFDFEKVPIKLTKGLFIINMIDLSGNKYMKKIIVD